MKHTPGPWKIERFSKEQPPYLIAPPKSTAVICEFGSHPRIRSLPREVQEANANLIAAAPELLEACKTALSFIHTDVQLDGIHDRELMATQMKLDAAIQKAEVQP